MISWRSTTANDSSERESEEGEGSDELEPDAETDPRAVTDESMVRERMDRKSDRTTGSTD